MNDSNHLSPRGGAGGPGEGGGAALTEQQQRLQAASELAPVVGVDLMDDREFTHVHLEMILYGFNKKNLLN